jgi:WD40 repeat protein
MMMTKLSASRSNGWGTKAPFEFSRSTGTVMGQPVRQTRPQFRSPIYILIEIAKRPESEKPAYMFNPVGSKVTVCAFTYTPGIIVTGHESGKMALFDVKTGDEINSNERAHMDTVTDLQLSKDRTHFITSSKDKTARVRPPVLFQCGMDKALMKFKDT